MVWLRRVAWGVAGLLAVWAVAWLAVPPLLKSQAESRLSALLGREVLIGEVAFKPWALDLTLRNVRIMGLPGASGPLLELAQAHVDLSINSLFRRAPVIEALELDGLQMRVARTSAGHYDIDDLIERFTPRADAPASEPARFALYNLQLRDAQLRFDDRPVARVQQVDALHLALPFLSNLPGEVDVKVEPRLAFKLNGTPFDSGAQATPFAQTRSGELKLTVAGLDLAPYLGYLPEALPVRVVRGAVSADLALQFTQPQGAAPNVKLSGSVGARGLAVNDTAGAPLLAWRELQLGLRDVQPLARRLAFGALRIDGAQVHAVRDAAGQINLLRVAGQGAGASAPATASTAPRADAGAWQVALDTLDVVDARVLWNDAAVKPAIALQLDAIGLGAKQLQWPLVQAVPVTFTGVIKGQADGAAEAGRIDVQATATDRAAQATLVLKALSFDAFAPYVAQFIAPRVQGSVSGEAQLDWSAAADAPRLVLALPSASIDALRVSEGAGRSVVDAVSLKQLALADVRVDLLARSVQVGQVRVLQPAAAVARGADGRLNLERWPVDAAKSHVTTQVMQPTRATPPAQPPSPATAWHVQVKDVTLEGGQLQWADETLGTGAEPLRAELTGLRMAIQGIDWHGARAVPAARVQVAARVGPPRSARGKRDEAATTGLLDYKGQLGLQPLNASGALRIERLPVHLFMPYAGDKLPVRIARAEVGYTGKLTLRQLANGLDVSAAGDVLLADVQVTALPDAKLAGLTTPDELLSWQSFALKGVTFAMKPGARPQVEVAEAALSDFYSRLVITEQGRFNLQDVGAPPGGVAAGAATATPAALNASAAATPSTASPVSTASAASPASAAAPPEPAPLPLDIKVGITRLANGRVDFSDRFVRPNYSAALTELNGQLGAFNSTSRDMATLALRGRAAGTALLEISGQLNPTARPLALDIQAKATDLELAPLSPYAGKYAGYAIERGKLSMEVAYKIDADGKLDARNQVVLNQLTFGDKIDSPDATKLPVLLAVALLKDRNGVIDLNLPVSGSVNDPKFSIGGIIVKVIVNILTKAFTAPFALLAGGGSDDLSLVEFQPGTAVLTAGGAGAVDKVAKALSDRPALKMTVTGAADPVAERDAFQQAVLEARLRSEQRREAQRSGAPAAALASASASAPASEAAASASAAAPAAVRGDERAVLLKSIYKQTDLPDKPRNAIGFAKDIAPAEMESLLKRHVLVTTEAARELALQRGIAVRDALIAKGLPSERLFLAAPKLRASGDEDAAWTPRVQLALTMN